MRLTKQPVRPAAPSASLAGALPHDRPKREPHPLRAPVIGLIGVGTLCVLTIDSDLVLQGSWIAHNSLPIGALTLFLLLVVVGNRLAQRVRPAWALTRAEALLVYAMLLVAAGIPSVGLTLPVLSVAVAPAY